MKLDTKNPDDKFRKLPIKGSRILRELRYNPENKSWENGQLYIPDDGKVYSCSAKVSGSKMMINYYNEDGSDVRSWTWVKQN